MNTGAHSITGDRINREPLAVPPNASAARKFMNAGDGFFVDSNLLLYYVDSVEGAKRARANEWLEALWLAGTGRLSWQVLHEFYWNAVRKMRLAPVRAR